MQINLVNSLYFVFLLASIVTYGIALKTKERYILTLFIYQVLALVVTILAIVLIIYVRLDNNLFLFHIFTPVEYTLLAVFFSEVIASPRSRRLIVYSIPAFIGASIVFTLFIQKIGENNSYITIIEAILVICWSLLFFRELLLTKQVSALHRYPLFWIVAGLLFYFTETFVIEGLLAYMINRNLGLARQVYRISFIFKYLLFLSLAIGAYLRMRVPNEKQ